MCRPTSTRPDRRVRFVERRGRCGSPGPRARAELDLAPSAVAHSSLGQSPFSNLFASRHHITAGRECGELRIGIFLKRIGDVMISLQPACRRDSAAYGAVGGFRDDTLPRVCPLDRADRLVLLLRNSGDVCGFTNPVAVGLDDDQSKESRDRPKISIVGVSVLMGGHVIAICLKRGWNPTCQLRIHADGAFEIALFIGAEQFHVDQSNL